MIQINMSDVMNVINNCKPYLIALAVLLIAAILVIIAVRRLAVPRRKLVRAQSLIAMLLAVVVVVNLICFGPMSTMLTLATTKNASGENEGHVLAEETVSNAKDLCERIEEEGIVLLKNEENTLPLTNTKKLNVFGWSSTNPIYAGIGSGALSDVYPKVTLLDGLTNAGFELNTELSDFYTAFRDARPSVNAVCPDWSLPEPTTDSYDEEMLDNAKAFSDTALIVLSRDGGEGVDLPYDMTSFFDGSRTQENMMAGTCDIPGYYLNNSMEYNDFNPGEHYLQLSQTEEKMVDMVCDQFETVIVIYNGSNTLELGWVDEHPQIKGVLWCPGAGQCGFDALGNILNGTVNPSAKTTDTFVYDLKAAPSYNNFGSFVYDNMSEHNNAYYYYGTFVNATRASFVNYVEGIYVGYRYYETAAAEGFIDYDATVQYPFGYGLSYATFSQEMGEIHEADDTLSFDVTVTNTGDVTGKDVVEVYYNPPYTNGGIEKASANLIAFDKTDLLEPGDSQTLTISFCVEDMVSYDEYEHGCYVLEEGEYVISINENSHDIIDSQVYTVESTIVYDERNARTGDDVAAVNQFSNADDGVEVFLSRADGFANYDAATQAPDSLTMAPDLKEQFISNVNYDATDEADTNAVVPITGAKNGVKLADLRGKEYDDPLWEDLLDQLSVKEMDTLISLAGYQTQAIDSVGKIATTECDGPVAINNSFTGEATIGFPPAVILANTWNEGLAYEYGNQMGTMAAELNVDGWYAPAMNMHRSAFGGRNFEYYSEDGLLSGKLAAKAVAGAKDQGIYAFIKHFALNDQESNRLSMLCTWTNEQAIREIYLKPFEIAVKEGGAFAVMTALNYIGPVAAGSTDALLNTVLRDEWGFRGMVITDYFGMYGYQNADQQIRNGNDGCLVAYDVEEAHVRVQDATGVQAMRTAAKNIMYTVVNSRAYENGGVGTTPTWVKLACGLDAALAILIIILEIVTILKYKRRMTAENNKAKTES